MPDPSVLLGRLAGEFAARVREGELPSIEEYAARHPELAERIRALFPMLLLLESPARADSSATAPQDPPPAGAAAEGQSFGPYRLVREIGRGGMGVVYEAVHRALDKRVALKALPLLQGVGADQVERFLREARTAAALHHTNIVPVFDVGQCNGVPYFAMQLIQGRGLDEALRDWQTTPPADPFRRIAFLGAQAAEALQHAHERGVIHRDIKPSNLLLDGEGVLWVADFGLARRAADSSMTQSGAVVGTPRYMSPEQAEGGRRGVDHRSDVYSLGATLYELLTGRPPFSGATAVDVLLQVIGNDPVPPRRINRAVPLDLETLTLRAMAKHPEDRYQTAGELADDLRRCLDGEPVRARRIGALGRARRWARRNPALAALTAAVFVSLIAGVLVASYFAWEADRRATEAANSEASAVGSARQANIAREGATRDKEAAIEARDQSDDRLYAVRFSLLQTAFANDDRKRLDGLLADTKPADGERDRRGWEWHYLYRTIHGERRTAAFARPTMHDRLDPSPDGPRIQKVAWSDDLRRVAVLDTIRATRDFPGRAPGKGPQTGQVSVWDAGTGKRLFRQELPLKPGTNFRPIDHLAMSRDGRRLAWTVRGRLTLWDVEKNQALPAPEPGGQATEIALDATGKHFAVVAQRLAPAPPPKPTGSPFALPPLPQRGGYFLALGDCETGKAEPIGDPKEDSHLSLRGFLGDGRYLLYTGASAVFPPVPGPPTVVLWDVAGKRERLRLPGSAMGDTAVALSPDGKWLAVAGPNDGFRVWDMERGKQAYAVADKGPTGMEEPARDLVFSPDGSWLVSQGAGHGLRFWDVASGRELSRLADCPADATALRFSPKGLPLAVGDVSGRITLFTSDGPPQTLRGHAGAVSHLAFREGALCSFGEDGAFKEWDLSRPPAVRFLAGGDGQFQPRAPLHPRSPLSPTTDFQADGRSLVVWARVAGPGGLVPAPDPVYAWRRFDPTGGKELPAAAITGMAHRAIHRVSQSRGGRIAARDLQLAPNTLTGAPLCKMPMWPSADPSLASLCSTAWYWSSGGARWEVAVWDAATNKVCFQAAGYDIRAFDHFGAQSRMTLSPDGRYLAAYTDALHLWEIAGQREVPLPERAPGLEPITAAFSPDGRRLALLSREPQPMYPPEVYRAPEGSPDRPALLSVVDLGTGQAVWRHPVEVKWNDATGQLAFTPDGRGLMATHTRQSATGVGGALHVQVWATARAPEAPPLLDTLLSWSGLARPDKRTDIAFSPDGRLAALRTEDDLALWDLTTGRVRHTLKGVCRYLQRMTFGPDGGRLFLAAGRPGVSDGSAATDLHVFDTKSGQLLLTLPLSSDFAGAVVGLQFDGGRLIVSRVTESGSVEFQSFDGTPAAG
jgi:WD40 repeat protein